jgi:hypothetical protein
MSSPGVKKHRVASLAEKQMRASVVYSDESLAGGLDYAPVMHGDGRINQIAVQRAESR